MTNDLRGAIQLVGPEHLDPRQEWVSVDFVLDSVARGALQDLSDYMGQELEPAAPPREPAQQSAQSPVQAARGRRQKRVKYSTEDDARMLVFLQVTGLLAGEGGETWLTETWLTEPCLSTHTEQLRRLQQVHDECAAERLGDRRPQKGDA